MTLLSAENEAGPFTAVPDGSAVMSPLNRKNPDVSGADGHFGWDVVAAPPPGPGSSSNPHAPQPTPNVLKKKPLKCKKGFKRHKVHGKAKCMKLKKKHHSKR